MGGIVAMSAFLSGVVVWAESTYLGRPGWDRRHAWARAARAGSASPPNPAARSRFSK